MRESFWGLAIVFFGIFMIFFMYLFQKITNTEEHNYHILKEVTEAAAYDALDLASYRYSGIVRVDREKFVENFVRRFAESALLSNEYTISIYDVNEQPPKFSIKIVSSESTNITNSDLAITITTRLDAIFETPY